MGGDGQPQGAEPVLLCGICRLDLRGVAFQRADPCRDGIPRQRESVLLRVQHGGRHRASRTSRVGGRKLGAQPGDLAQSRGNIPFVPPQHRLPRMVQEVAGMRPGAKDGADGPLGAAQELTAGSVQVGRFNEPVTVTGIRRARRHFNDRGCHPRGDEDGCRRNGTAADISGHRGQLRQRLESCARYGGYTRVGGQSGLATFRDRRNGRLHLPWPGADHLW
jgi:hypothetical protein